jgi:RNase P/RNase MRP subunit p29
MRSWMMVMLMTASVAASGVACAQKAPSAPAADLSQYDARREANVVGTVVDFTANSVSAPFGARITLRTHAGLLEVHLGDPRFLAANHFSIQAGDTVRIVGETLARPNFEIFVARIVERGTQALAIRTARGSLIPYVAPRNEKFPVFSHGVV